MRRYPRGYLNEPALNTLGMVGTAWYNYYSLPNHWGFIMQSFVILADLAQELGLDRSNMRKYVLKQGFSFLQVRTPKSRGQSVLALTEQDAELVRELRSKQGFLSGQPIENGHGWFYLVQIAPDLDPKRIKLGFASDPARRVDSYRTLSPTVILVKAWRCRASWEPAAIASLTRQGAVSLGGEVFQIEDLDLAVNCGDAFFSIMPSV